MQFFQPKWKEQQEPHQLQYQRFRVTPTAIPFPQCIGAMLPLSKHGTFRGSALLSPLPRSRISLTAKTKGVTQA